MNTRIMNKLLAILPAILGLLICSCGHPDHWVDFDQGDALN